jgi:Cu/Ag efflux protein CusF
VDHVADKKEAHMLKAMVGVMTLTFMLSGAAWAADVQGKIKSVDTSEKSFTLEDGTKVWVGAGMPMDKLKEGSDVKASYDEKDGKNLATSIEVRE